jgi:hypothetical protein
VFAGLTTDTVQGKLPPGGVRHPGCTSEPPRGYARGELRGQVVRWSGCGQPWLSFSEVGLYHTGGRYAVYVQVKQTAADDHTTEILDSLRVRAP